jgi:phosphoglucomutase/phosphopentomutase
MFRASTLMIRRGPVVVCQGRRGLSSPADRSSIRALAEQWVRYDPNAATRGHIQASLVADDYADLSARLGKRLAFGTAGLRGPFGAGTSRMNDLVVLQTAQGLCRYLQAVFSGKEELQKNGVCVGYDHRAMGDVLSSKTFALITSAVFMSQGIKVHLFDGFVATPLVPFCVEQHGCAAGIMVTASHNPKEDDGYKVYWSNGAQIIAPHDKGIEAKIGENLEPWKEAVELLSIPEKLSPNGTGVLTEAAELRQSPLCSDPTADVGARYFQQMSDSLCRYREENGLAASIPITYTAMHGVGHAWTSRSFDAFGLPPYVPVNEQLHPDPTFPTVPFPNPEEGEGALAMSFAAAEAAGSRLVIANDPDADRLAVAELDCSSGEWRVFTGNEIGVLLGHWQWSQHKADSTRYPKGLAMLASTVSSKMLRAVAAAEGFRFEETLTG